MALKLDVRVGESLKIGDDITITLARKDGQRCSLILETGGKPVRKVYNPVAPIVARRGIATT